MGGAWVPQDYGAIEASAALLKAEPMTEKPERLVLPSALAFAALAAPDAVTEVYDAAARGWLGRAVEAPPIVCWTIISLTSKLARAHSRNHCSTGLRQWGS